MLIIDITNKILIGDILFNLRRFPSNSIKLTVTSPPFYKARSYELEGQWGTEKTLDEYLSNIREFVFELHRITKDDGYFALNLGDVKINGDWAGIPENVIQFAKEIGWYIVSKVVWIKSNKMPTSSPRGFSFQWEPFYLLAKSRKRVFHFERVLLPAKTKTKKFNVRVRDSGKGKWDEIYQASKDEKNSHNAKGEKMQDNTIGSDGKPKGNYEGFNERYQHKELKRMSDVWIHSVSRLNRKGRRKHPAPFPDYIVEPFVKTCSDEGDLVLDPFSGIGTTCIVAKRLKRKYCGIELDPYWVKESLKDLENV